MNCHPVLRLHRRFRPASRDISVALLHLRLRTQLIVQHTDAKLATMSTTTIYVAADAALQTTDEWFLFPVADVHVDTRSATIISLMSTFIRQWQKHIIQARLGLHTSKLKYSKTHEKVIKRNKNKKACTGRVKQVTPFWHLSFLTS